MLPIFKVARTVILSDLASHHLGSGRRAVLAGAAKGWKLMAFPAPNAGGRVVVTAQQKATLNFGQVHPFQKPFPTSKPAHQPLAASGTAGSMPAIALWHIG